MLTLTVTAGPDLEQQWRDLESVRARFGRGGWKQEVVAWRRQTELTWRPTGWHLHDHIVVACPNEAVVDRAAKEAITAWLASAKSASVRARPGGQMQSDPGWLVGSYPAKGLMVRSMTPDSSSPLDLLEAWALQGDAEAEMHWREIEHFLDGYGRGKRWAARSRRR